MFIKCHLTLKYLREKEIAAILLVNMSVQMIQLLIINEYDASNIYSCNNSEFRENASSFLSSTSLEEKRCLLIEKFAVAANCIGMNDTVLQQQQIFQ